MVAATAVEASTTARLSAVVKGLAAVSVRVLAAAILVAVVWPLNGRRVATTAASNRARRAGSVVIDHATATSGHGQLNSGVTEITGTGHCRCTAATAAEHLHKLALLMLVGKSTHV